MKKILRAKEISKIYNISLSTIWRLAKKGELKTKKISHRLTLFDAEEIDKYFRGA